ncbi:MAG: GNAT family N-acetyltransferase [Bacteroidota bacterium]|nr:GNAT family N-acetyltransferase [Bacteroidota bacterium]
MQLKHIDTNSKTYLDFINQSASVYNTSDWLKLYGSKCKVKGVYYNNILVAVFNTYSFKKSILSFSIPPPFMPDCALLIACDTDTEQMKEAVKKWMEQSISKKKHSLFRFNVSYKYSELFNNTKIKGLNSKWNHTYVLDLTKAEDVQTLYAPKRRQQIRRAIKDNLQVKRITDMQVVFDLVKKTFARQSKSIDEAFVRRILFEYANKNNSFAFASSLDGKNCVVYFCIYHNKEAFYLLGGFDESIKHIGAGPLAMSACIEHAKKIGIETYDFEGSMEQSIEKYFKEFGGTKKQYLCFERSSKLGEIAVKIKKLIKG